MLQNTINQSNTSIQLGYKAYPKNHPIPSQKEGPFMVSRCATQTVTKHQVSSSAHWTNLEKQNYSIFVCYFRQFLSNEKAANSDWNMFKGMSKFVKTRNPQQCRSHHLKLTTQFKRISKFILMVLDRIPKLKERILQAENELGQIQNQFNLYFSQPRIEKIHSISENGLFVQEDSNQTIEQHAVLKGDKQQYIKTADSYIQQQHPVKNNNSFNFFSSRSEFKPFDNFKPNPNRSSLPSFGDEDEDQPKVKKEYKPHTFSKAEKEQNQMKSFLLENNTISQQQNFNIFSKNISIIQNEDSGLQKMKQFLECHYLFQLWTSKLEKIMRHS